jgi:uncharacterized protein YndB with AHSA1/START domain
MDLHFERRYPAPVERVWWAITDPDALARWYMPADGLVAEPGRRFTLHDADAKGWSGWLDCEVLAVEPLRRFAYRSIERRDHLVTDVTWTLTEQADGTLVRLDHTGFTGWNGLVAGTILRFGWRRLLTTELAELLHTRHTASDSS